MIEEITLKAIANYGFPIVMCLLMYYHSVTTTKDNTKAIRELIVWLKGGCKR